MSGLAGAGLVLRNNGGDDLAVASNGAFTFATSLTSGSTYSVTVATQPSGQTCSVSNGSGTVAGANVTNVAVACCHQPAAEVHHRRDGDRPQREPGSSSGTTAETTSPSAANGTFTFATSLHQRQHLLGDRRHAALRTDLLRLEWLGDRRWRQRDRRRGRLRHQSTASSPSEGR